MKVRILSLLLLFQTGNLLAGDRVGNGGTGVFFDKNKATLADYYFKAQYEPMMIEDEVREEVVKIKEIAKNFDLDLEDTFWDCLIEDKCEKESDFRFVRKLPKEIFTSIDKNKMTKDEINALQCIATYGYTEGKITWIVKDLYNKFSIKDKALALIHERLHTLHNNHDHIMWYIQTLSLLSDILNGDKKWDNSTYEFLKTYSYYAHSYIMTKSPNGTDWKSSVQEYKYTEYLADNILAIYDNKEKSKDIKFNFRGKRKDKKLWILDFRSLTYFRPDDSDSSSKTILSFDIELMNPKNNCEMNVKELIQIFEGYIRGSGNNISINCLAPNTTMYLRPLTILAAKIEGNDNNIVYNLTGDVDEYSSLNWYGHYYNHAKIKGDRNNVVLTSKQSSLVIIEGSDNVCSVSRKYKNSTVSPACLITGDRNFVIDSNAYSNSEKNNGVVRLIGSNNIIAYSHIHNYENLIVYFGNYGDLLLVSDAKMSKKMLLRDGKISDFTYDTLSEVRCTLINDLEEVLALVSGRDNVLEDIVNLLKGK